MALLPQKVGSVTLMRSLGNDGVTESYVGISDHPAGRQVIVRRVLPSIAREDERLTHLRNRVGDLLPIRNGNLLGVLEMFEEGGETWLVEEWVDSVSLSDIVRWCAREHESLPHNVFLHIAVQICNGLEALHSRPGAASGTRNVLHLCVRPESVAITRDGDVRLCNYGLVRSPTFAPHTGGIRMKTAYLSPEQTHPDQKLTPASDLFSLGAVLYELLVHKPMFADSTPLRTIARVRKAEVTTQLLEVKEIVPGVDRVLYRALSLHQRHRYQRAFVLREDLRGLMAGYSFSDIDGEARSFLEPLFQGRTRAIDEVTPPLASPANETTNSLLDDTLSGVRLIEHGSLARDARLDADREGAARPEADGDTDPTGVFDAPRRRGSAPFERPVTYAHEANEVSDRFRVPFATERMDVATDESSLPSVTRSELAALIPGPFGIARDSSEELDLLARDPTDLDEPAAPTEEDDRPVPLPSPVEPERLPPADEPSASWVPSRADLLRDEDDDDESAVSSAPLLAGALGLGLATALAVVCAGGTVAGAVGLNRMAADRPVLADVRPVSMARPAAPSPADPVDPPALADLPVPAKPVSAEPRPIVRPTPRPRPIAGAQAPRPRPAAPTRPAPVEPVVAAAMEASRGDPTLKDADWDVEMLVAEDLSPLGLEEPPAPDPEPAVVAVAPVEPSARSVDPTLVASTRPMAPRPPADLGVLATAAYAGQLDGTAQAGLQSIGPQDERFTRARVLLYQDAKARGDEAGRRRWMGELMLIDANRYRPELLVEQAALAMADGDWQAALDLANRAEQHWSRLPRALIVTRKAMIHEIQGNAAYALYAAGDPPSEARLDASIDAWTRHRTHALGAGRVDLVGKAEQRLAQLQDVRRRMH